jgi:prepilin-type N-terminal cleavage/methylation domain-containing protein
MSIPKHCPRWKPHPAAGFTLLEVIVALVLLGVCLVPAANALRSTMGAPAATASAAHNLDCVSSLMENVMAEPYNHLLPVAKGKAMYVIAPDTTCPNRQVSVSLYGNNTTGKIGPGATDEDLLYISVSLADPADGPPYTLTSLMTR